jgi:hypothetical protein
VGWRGVGRRSCPASFIIFITHTRTPTAHKDQAVVVSKEEEKKQHTHNPSPPTPPHTKTHTLTHSLTNTHKDEEGSVVCVLITRLGEEELVEQEGGDEAAQPKGKRDAHGGDHDGFFTIPLEDFGVKLHADEEEVEDEAVCCVCFLEGEGRGG